MYSLQCVLTCTVLSAWQSYGYVLALCSVIAPNSIRSVMDNSISFDEHTPFSVQ